MADKIFSVENYLPDFYLSVPEHLENFSTYDKLAKIFESNEGDSNIFLKKSGKWKKLNKKIFDSKKIRAELKNLLGEKNFKIY